MCGIAGIFFGALTADQRACTLDAMLRTLEHRGPDGRGAHTETHWAIGHRRLAIIAPADGQQPMWSHDGRYCLSYNGEVYNYLELRTHLESLGVTFRTQSDTEVLLELLIREGHAGLPRCNGMFAFAFYDTKKRTLLLARDHFGIKPLYYAHLPENGFVFASEIKALLHCPGVTPEVDAAGLNEYLVFQFRFGAATLFKGIYKIEPGQALLLTQGNPPKILRWHTPNHALDAYHNEHYFLEMLTHLLERSIQQQLRSDVPLGAYLSGGLDSSIVTTLAARNTRGLSCFTGYFTESQEYDETPYARAVAEACGAQLHTVAPTAQDFTIWMPRIIHALDEPVAGPGVFPQFLVSRLASQHVKVCLGGQGGDELFGGYARYLVAYLEQTLKGAIYGVHSEGNFVVTLDSIVPNMTTLRQYVPMIQEFWKEGVFGEADSRYFALINRAPSITPMLTGDMRENLDMARLEHTFSEVFNSSESASSINRMLYFDQNTLLPALLQIEDRASMYSGLESRVPLLDPDIAALAASIPPTIKLKCGKLKNALLAAAKSFVIPEVTQRKDKMGFPVPLGEWARCEPVRGFIADTLLSSASLQRGIFTPQALRGLMHGTPTCGNRQLWGILCLELWFQNFIDKSPARPAA